MTALPCSGDHAIVAPGPARPRPRLRTGRPRLGRRLVLALIATTLLLAPGCGVGRSEDDGAKDESGATIDRLLEDREENFLGVTFDRIDQRLRDRAAEQGLTGAAIVVEPAEGEGHRYVAGAVDLSRALPMAETSMWPTAAVLLTLVDDGTLGLDDPVGGHLRLLTGPAASITLRQLLSHTSGLPAHLACAEPTVVACDEALTSSALVAAPGEAFSVTDLDAHVAARLAETVTGQTWADLFAERIAEPTGMAVTTYADPATTGGLLAVDGSTTPLDFGRFLAMIRDGGTVDGQPVLSPASQREMLLDQTVRLDTHTEAWVAETGVPTYGLGVWRDRLRGSDVASVVSAPNRYGLYPFVDTSYSAWGIVVVDDHTNPRAEVVSSSALISQLTAAALRNPSD